MYFITCVHCIFSVYWVCLSYLNLYLHPEEHTLAAGLELEEVDPASGAGWHMHKLTIIREDGQVLLHGSGATILQYISTNERKS